jgi:hypothetical protein
LDIGPEHALGAAGDLSANATEVLGLAPPGYAPAAAGLLAGKETGPCHLGHLTLAPRVWQRGAKGLSLGNGGAFARLKGRFSAFWAVRKGRRFFGNLLS